MRAALGGDRARLVLQNPDDINLFLSAGLAPRGQIRLIPGFRRRLHALSASEGAARARGAVLRAACGAHALGQRRAGVRRSGARALKAQGRNVRFALAGTPDPGNPAALPAETLVAWRDSGDVEWLGQSLEPVPKLPLHLSGRCLA